jgi:hypothetical protein
VSVVALLTFLLQTVFDASVGRDWAKVLLGVGRAGIFNSLIYINICASAPVDALGGVSIYQRYGALG